MSLSFHDHRVITSDLKFSFSRIVLSSSWTLRFSFPFSLEVQIFTVTIIDNLNFTFVADERRTNFFSLFLFLLDTSNSNEQLTIIERNQKNALPSTIISKSKYYDHLYWLPVTK